MLEQEEKISIKLIFLIIIGILLFRALDNYPAYAPDPVMDKLPMCIQKIK